MKDKKNKCINCKYWPGSNWVDYCKKIMSEAELPMSGGLSSPNMFEYNKDGDCPFYKESLLIRLFKWG